MYDVVIIGGGPAGMTAALYALRNNKNVLVIEKNGFGGQICYSPRVENFPGFRSISGNELADHFLDQIISLGADVEIETVTSVKDQGNTKLVITEEGSQYETRAVIIATGVKHRMLGLPGEYDLVGNGISFCAVCDGDFYSGQTVAVIGGGNSALQEATLLADVCKEVHVIQNLDFFTGEEKLSSALLSRPNVKSVMGTVVDSFILKDGEFAGIKTRSEKSGETHDLHCDGLFVCIGLVPENGAFSDLTSLDDYGYINSGENCLTETSGIFAAGDCRKKNVRQLTTAAADGSVAALAACRYLDEIDQRL